VNPCRRHRSGHWCLLRTWLSSHDFVESFSIGDIHLCAAATEFRQRGQIDLLTRRFNDPPQRGFDYFGYGLPSKRGLTLDRTHYHVADIECCLHMENHIMRMGVSQEEWCALLSSPNGMRITRQLRRRALRSRRGVHPLCVSNLNGRCPYFPN